MRDGIQQIHHEAGGMLTLQVIQRADMPALIGDTLTGCDEAVQLLRLTRDTLGRIEGAPRRKPMLRASCPRALRGGRYALVVAWPTRDDPSTGLALAVCAQCGPDHGAIQVKAVVALARIWPDARDVVVTHPGGRA